MVADLEQLWSPEQIANRLRDEFGDDHGMRISHETIYKTLYIQGRGDCAGSWRAVCGPAAPGGCPAAGLRKGGGSPTWS